MKTPGDNPIRQAEEDLLGRSRGASVFARNVLNMDASEGLAVGVLGPWGSGKTSFLNLARPSLEAGSAAVLDFNPWMFSGAEQLVQSFFIEISAQLKVKGAGLAKLGEHLEEYGEAFSGLGWLPFVGSWIERGRKLSGATGRALKRRKKGIRGAREVIESALRDLEKPVVVLVDDIDRLSFDEVRDVFKLVRLTASFPNIVYVLAFDRVRVEQALEERGVPGRDYLEKILQTSTDLPVIPTSVMDEQVFAALQVVVDSVGSPIGFDEQAWPDIYAEMIRPLLRSMRDVRRYAASVRGTLVELKGHVEIVDVLGLEAIRVFLPDVYDQIRRSVDGLTSVDWSLPARGNRAELKAQVDELLNVAGDHEAVVTAMINRLFPAATTHLGGPSHGDSWLAIWRRERRVAHEDLLRMYFERVAGEPLTALTDADHAWWQFDEPKTLDKFLRGIAPMRLQDVLNSLEVYEDEFQPGHVAPVSTVLLNLRPALPDRNRSQFEFSPSMTVTRLVLRLFRTLEKPEERENEVRKILPELGTLTAKLMLLEMVGHREGVGHKLISETASDDLNRALREEVRAAGPEVLAAEISLARLLLVALDGTEAAEPELQVPDSPAITRKMLEGTRATVRAGQLGSRGVRKSGRLDWDSLVKIFGSEAEVSTRLDALDLSDDEELAELVEKYRSGWRPKDF